MSDAYDPNLDWTPPKIDNGEPEVSLEKWKFDALLRGAFNRSMQTIAEMARDDAAAGASQLGEEDKPPRLAADRNADAETPKPPPREPIPPEVLAAIEDRIEQLTERLDRFERMKQAEQALLDLENRIEAEMPPSQGDDDLALN
jgi:hypothetical protein